MQIISAYRDLRQLSPTFQSVLLFVRINQPIRLIIPPTSSTRMKLIIPSPSWHEPRARACQDNENVLHRSAQFGTYLFPSTYVEKPKYTRPE